MPGKQAVLLVVVPALLVLAAPSFPASGATPRALVSGEFRLPAATAFGEPGFHQVLLAARTVPSARLGGGPFRLTVSLRDAGRRTQRCSYDHPLSGCATVDWSDDPSRPNVPPGGVFDNRLTVRLASGTRTFFLRSSGALARRSEPYQPG